MEMLGIPGMWFVAATLLPLASFLLLLLAGAYRIVSGGRNNPPVKTGAYVATGAMAGAFVLCLIGSIQFLGEYNELHHVSGSEIKGSDSHGSGSKAHDHDNDAQAAQERFNDRWKGSWKWAVLFPQTDEPNSGTVLELGYHIDHLSVAMFLMVTFIATLIHIFSIGYMSEELQPVVVDHHVHTDHGHYHRRGRFGRFFLFLSLFCFSMLNLVLANNLFQIFLSWELVGICSYLLIGFYYERKSASNAANKAFITNRVGDAGFIIGLLILWTYVGTFNFEEIFAQIRAPRADHNGERLVLGDKVVRATEVPGKHEKWRTLRIDPNGDQVVLMGHVHADQLAPYADDKKTEANTLDVSVKPKPTDYRTMPYWMLVAAGLGIFLGCVGKSAQFPLHVWLPDAMEGPTPVSALIHAATMVAAGVYLVGRVFPLFTPESRLVIAYTGAITLFVAATIAIVMTDIKKVLAYSTVSQLGYMMLALGVGGWAAGLFHLITHAFFKALLFLGSGSVIYGCHHEQEMPKMGGLYPKMKITAITMLIGVLTIAGIPLFSGWYSKDAIIAHALGFVMANPTHLLLFILPLLTAGITTFYMFRMWFMTFTGKPRDHHVYENAHESPRTMTTPLIVLAFFSIVVAWGWPIWKAEESYLEHHLHHSQHPSVTAEFGPFEEGAAFEATVNPSAHKYAHDYHHLAGNLALAVVIIAIVFAYLIYYRGVLDPAEAKEQFPAVHRFLWHKWYFDELYSAVLVRPALVVAYWCRAFDTRVIDRIVDTLGRFTVSFSAWNGKFDLGIIDGLVNLVANVFFGIGARLRNVQTGYLRSYVLFLVIAAVAIFAILSYFVTMATAH